MSAWRVREVFVCGKAGDVRSCEDLLVETPRFVGVIDATSGFAGNSEQDRGVTFGRLIGIEVLRALESAGPDMAVHDIVRDASKRVAALKQSRGLASRYTGGAFFCVADLMHEELWRLGDCWYALDGCANKPTLAMEAPLSELRSAYLWARRLAGDSDAKLMAERPETALVAEYLKVKDAFANSTASKFGYGAINGDEVPPRFVEKAAIAPTTRAMVMGTDGYPVSGASLAEVEASLARALAGDPLMIGAHRGPKGLAPGLSSYDDRAFVALERVSAVAR